MRGPWYISARAVREYLALMRRPVVEDGPEWERAEAELLAMAAGVAELERLGVKSPKPVRGHTDLFAHRGPRPLRLQLIVSTAVRAEGALPQLVSVRPTHEGGVSSNRRRT